MAIKIMSEDLSNKIAAGEVVERPRSIVKELVENALDAGATEIKVQLEESGIRKIVVEDNGKGMDAADAILAFQRHATSKIFTENDLFSIHTLGFRGEALAAIASVSKINLHTGMKNIPSTRVKIHGGALVEQTSENTKIGTSITVEQLFYNTPARLKHLKSLQTEYAHTLEYLQKMALARPDVRFEFIHDNKVVFKTFGTGKLADTLVMIYGEKLTKYLFEVNTADNDFKVKGIITHPQMQRSNNRVINLSINQRSVRNFGINRAILSGYSHLIPKGMFPIVALDIEVDPKLVDVNVHPAKLEVRISQEKQLEALIQQLIKDTLVKENLIFQDITIPKKIQRAEQMGFRYDGRETKEEHTPNEATTRVVNYPNAPSAVQEDKISHGKFAKTALSQHEREAIKKVYDIAEDIIEHKISDVSQEYTTAEDNERVPTITNSREQEIISAEVPLVNDTFQAARTELLDLTVIGQFNASYILAQYDETLFLIDQHAAQERIKYDTHMRNVRAMEQITMQDLIFPLTIFLEVRELQVLFDHKAELLQNGIDFEQFSEQEIRVNAVPSWIKQENIETYIRKAIDCIVEYDSVDSAVIREKELIMLSCRYSIKAKDILNMAEMQALIKQLSETETPFTCPHGRPIVVKYRLYEIERWFKRV